MTMKKTRTQEIQEVLEKEGATRETARQAAVTIAADKFFAQRTPRGQNQVFKAWAESNGVDQ